MRARLILKLIGLVVTVVLGIVTFRSFSLSSSSPLQPSKLVGNAVSGLCADNQAIAAAGGGGTGTAATGASSDAAATGGAKGGGAGGGLQLGSSTTNLAPLVSDVGLAPSVLSCPPSSTSPAGSGG